MVDMVNRPPHYTDGKYECIDVMEETLGRNDVKAFCLCNAFKYLYRCKKKHGSPLEDAEKSRWYLNRYIKMVEDDLSTWVTAEPSYKEDVDPNQVTFDDLGIGTAPQSGGIG